MDEPDAIDGLLARWPSEAIGEACLGLQVRRTARAVTRRYDEALRPLGLTLGQFSILAAVNRSEAAAMTRLAERLGMDRTTLTANLRPLERRGLVAVVGDAGDRRQRRVAITDGGRALLAAALPLWELVQEELAGRLSAGPGSLKAALCELR